MKEHALLPFWHLGILNVAPGSCNHVPFLISSRLPSGNHSPRSLPVPKPHVPNHTCCLCFRVPEWRTHFLPPPSTALMLLFPASQSTALPPCLFTETAHSRETETTVFCPAFFHDLGCICYSSWCCGRVHDRAD